jgi:Protein of unknown function (DUF2442)
MPGTITLVAEVTNISKNGFWLLLGDEELLVPFDQFPWFKQATVAQITEVTWPTPDHLYGPHLDIDLSVDSIRRPQDVPLLARAQP